jgi:deoxyribose-phosphate aldolase
MDIRQYLDSTYLKTPEQAGLTPEENTEVVRKVVEEAIQEQFKLVMVRPDMVTMAKEMTSKAGGMVSVGTVIDFPEGKSALDTKLSEAQKAINDGADELDFVLDYEAFKAGDVTAVKQQVLECTRLGLSNNKIVKWIIEVAALDNHHIVQLSALVKNVVMTYFEEAAYNNVFVKSSTGFYPTENGVPNGATPESIQLMLENSFPLPVKAAGGVRSYDEAIQMINMGVKRIGTSSAKAIVSGAKTSDNY